MEIPVLSGRSVPADIQPGRLLCRRGSEILNIIVFGQDIIMIMSRVRCEGLDVVGDLFVSGRLPSLNQKLFGGHALISDETMKILDGFAVASHVKDG